MFELDGCGRESLQAGSRPHSVDLAWGLEAAWLCSTVIKSINQSLTDSSCLDELSQWLCQCQILHIHWSQHITNAAAYSARTGLLPIMDFIRRRRLSVFGHIAWLTQRAPAYDALYCQVALSSGRSLGKDCRRRPVRPHARWTDQLRHDTGFGPCQSLETSSTARAWWSYATARADYAMTTTTMI